MGATLPEPRRITCFRPAIVLVLAMLVAGCRGWRGEEFNDEFSNWGRQQRGPSTSSGQSLGLSAKSRQIERNLGVE